MKRLPTAQALKVCADIGYRCVELALLPGWPTEPRRLTAADRRELRGQLADADLTLAALMENLAEPADDTTHRANLDRLRAAAELGHALAPKAPPIIETVLGGKPAQWDAIRERLAERLRAWAEVGKASNCILAVKPHVGHALHLPEQAKWLLRQVGSPWIKLAFDYSHFLLRGLPLDRTVAELVPQSAFVHVKDARGNAERFQFLLPGEGRLDYAAYFERVWKAGYRGPVVVEVSSQLSNQSTYDPIAAARQSYAKLAPALEKLSKRPR